MHPISRRDFVRLGAGAVAAGAAIKSTILEPTVLAAQAAPSGRQIRFASIGTGIRGCDLLRSARKVPGGVLVGTADLYDMHRKAGVEAYGTDVPTTRDYRSLLDRKDVDAVIVAVADHQHRRVRARISHPHGAIAGHRPPIAPDPRPVVGLPRC